MIGIRKPIHHSNLKTQALKVPKVKHNLVIPQNRNHPMIGLKLKRIPSITEAK